MPAKTDTASFADLTLDQQAALRSFAVRNGRAWKDKLMAGWMRTAYPGPLQQIRNTFGPSWLMKVRIPKD